MLSPHSRWSVVLLVVLLTSGTSFAIDFTEIARFNLGATASDPLNPEYIGSNPSAVAWTGSRLFVAGFNNNNDLGDAGLIEVLNATATGNVETPTFSPRLQSIFSNAFRGYISLDVSSDGNSLGVAYDDGAPFIEGFQVYNTSNNTQRWNFSARGSSGVSFDPGFQGVDTGTAFGQFGAGRRLLHNTTTGSQTYDSTNGMLWYDNMGPGSFIRDMDFDPDTGDIYVRHNNQLSKAIRTSGNAATPQGVISAGTDAPFVGFQNLSFLSNTSEGDLVIFNDRDDNSTGIEFVDSIMVVDSSGMRSILHV